MYWRCVYRGVNNASATAAHCDDHTCFIVAKTSAFSGGSFGIGFLAAADAPMRMRGEILVVSEPCLCFLPSSGGRLRLCIPSVEGVANVGRSVVSMNYGYAIVVAAPSAFKVAAPLGTFESIIGHLDADTEKTRMEMNGLVLWFLV